MKQERLGMSAGAAAGSLIVVAIIAMSGYLILQPSSSSPNGTTAASAASVSSAVSILTNTTAVTAAGSTADSTTIAGTASTSEPLANSTTSSSVGSSTTITTASVSTATVILPQGAGLGKNFSPATLTVAPGTNIIFVDQDSTAPHNVYFTSVPAGANILDNSNPPTLVKGESYSVILTVPGTYEYDCQFHAAWMVASIIVT